MSETPVIRQDKAFEVISPYTPSGDQPKAIRELAARIRDGEQDVVLMGATGTGKSATTAWLIEELQRPALVLEPNKTLAAQLAAEFRELLPGNAVEYFVSYYDYYQPEAYVPQTDTFIEKDSSIMMGLLVGWIRSLLAGTIPEAGPRDNSRYPAFQKIP